MKKVSLYLFLSACSLSPKLQAFLMKIEDGKVVTCVPNESDIMRAGGTGINIPTSGYTISVAGKYFVGDLPPAFAVGVTPITITASDVELDLNGFTITGPGTSTGAGDDGIFVDGATNVVIKNGTIEQIDGIGIRINNSTSIFLDDILCRSNAVDGFNVTVTGNRHCSIANCRSEGNDAEGFFDAGGSTISYKNCTAFNNGSDGFDLTANNHLMEDCTSNENTGLGLSSTGTAMDVINCHFDENTAGGLLITNMSDFCIQDCTFNRNSSTGLLFTTASDGSVVRCCIIGNGSHGVRIAGTSDTISVCKNSIINNTDKGITLDISTTQSCQINENKVVGNGRSKVDDAYGIDIGGNVYNLGSPGGDTQDGTTPPTARSHFVTHNFAQNNGGGPGGTLVIATDTFDTNYSNDVIASPTTGSTSPNGLIVTASSGRGAYENVTV